jgi:hypothetical protein
VPARLRSQITRLEIGGAVLAALVLAALVVIEPAILEAPFQSGRTVAFTVGGTLLAAAAFVALAAAGVPAGARMLLLGIPFVAVNVWLLRPYFVDEAVDDAFAVTIADAAPPTSAPAPSTTAPSGDAPGTTTTTVAPPEPRLLGSGPVVGLAGHEGTGTAAVFLLPDGSQVVRFEALDIENGPDLELYVVPGADQVSPAGGIHLGPLRGNVGDQTYELPEGAALAPGEWTVLVWCEAFSVEFVAATVAVA